MKVELVSITPHAEKTIASEIKDIFKKKLPTMSEALEWA